jgi:hypothetical protein
MPYVNRNAGNAHGPSENIQVLRGKIKPSPMVQTRTIFKNGLRFVSSMTAVRPLANWAARKIGYAEIPALGVDKCDVFLNWDHEEEMNESEELEHEALIKEFGTAQGYEVAVDGGELAVFSLVGNRKTKMDVKTPELQRYLVTQKALWNGIYKNNIDTFIELNQPDLRLLYTRTINPVTGAMYTDAEAGIQVANLLTYCSRAGSTSQGLFGLLQADGILNAQRGTISAPVILRPMAVKLERLYAAHRYLNDPNPPEALDQSVASNLADRMREKRKVLVGKMPFTNVKRHAFLPWRYMSLVGKRITQVYRFFTGGRLKTRDAVRGAKWGWPIGVGKRSNGLRARYNAALGRYNAASAAAKAAATQVVEAHRLDKRSRAPTPMQKRLYNDICTVNALQDIHAIDPQLRLLGEMFEAYHENLSVVKDNPEKCGERMRKYFYQMVEELAIKRSIAGARPGRARKAGSPVEVTPEDKQQIYRLFSYVLPTSPGTRGLWEVDKDILQEYSDIALEDDDLKDCIPTEKELEYIGHTQQLLFNELL